MSLRLQSKHPADFLERIQHADGVTPELVAKLAAQAGVRLDGSARLCRLMAAEAWTEVALVLIEMALPAWRPVRLVFDDGEWCCALSRHWQLPDWLDEAVEARHALVPLALLGAAVQALQTSREPTAGDPRTVPQGGLPSTDVLDVACCENFA